MPEPTSIALLGLGSLGLVTGWVRRAYRKAKRTIDVCGAVILLVALSPVMAMIAILVKLTSRGPVIYSQDRVGLAGRVFTMHKFRSMTVDAETGTGPVWAKKADPRVTPIGGLLRRTHLDELPQLWNVIAGEMSLIGPRPERPFFVEQLKSKIPGYQKRLSVRPGITGLAQVRHRADETVADVRKKMAYDLLYLRRMCLWLDVRIIALTIPTLLGLGSGSRT